MIKIKKNFVLVMSSIFFLIFAAVLIVGAFFYMLVSPAQKSVAEKSFVVPEGERVKGISEALFREGLIRSKFVFETYIWLLQKDHQIVAGEYALPENLSIVGLTSKLLRGPEKPRDRNITLIEGWGRVEIAEYLEKEGLVSEEDFLEKTKELEGYLFPDTYRVFPDASSEEIIKKMLDNFHSKVNEELREEIRQQGKTLEEVLTLASVVEAEVRTFEDRKKVADIFLKRLKIGMPLQSDATVNFLTRSGRSRSTFNDLQIESPYNTYKYVGLPPGPINNPSLQSILAVVRPTPNDYYYFLTDSDGNVHYARNQDEHNVNRAKYLK